MTLSGICTFGMVDFINLLTMNCLQFLTPYKQYYHKKLQAIHSQHLIEIASFKCTKARLLLFTTQNHSGW